jgi:predicted porin
MRLGVQYKGGPLMVNFMYQTTADGVIDIDGGTAGPVSDYFDRDVMSIGLGWKMGKNTIKFQYAMANDLDCATLGSACDDTGATMYGIGLDHALSKESTVYIMYAATQNDDAPWRVTSGGGHADDVGTSIVNGEVQDPSSISAGYIVKF